MNVSLVTNTSVVQYEYTHKHPVKNAINYRTYLTIYENDVARIGFNIRYELSFITETLDHYEYLVPVYIIKDLII